MHLGHKSQHRSNIKQETTQRKRKAKQSIYSSKIKKQATEANANHKSTTVNNNQTRSTDKDNTYIQEKEANKTSPQDTTLATSVDITNTSTTSPATSNNTGKNRIPTQQEFQQFLKDIRALTTTTNQGHTIHTTTTTTPANATTAATETGTLTQQPTNTKMDALVCKRAKHTKPIVNHQQEFMQSKKVKHGNRLPAPNKMDDNPTTRHLCPKAKTNPAYHPKELTIFIASKKGALTNIGTTSIHTTLHKYHGGQFKLIRPKANYIIIHCSTYIQMKKYLAIGKIGNIPVTITPHKKASRPPTKLTSNIKPEMKLRQQETETYKKTNKAAIELDKSLAQNTTKDIKQHTTEDNPASNGNTQTKTYTHKVRYCDQCQRWGHNKYKCKYRPRCPKCGDEHKDTCNITNQCCPNCKGPHTATSDHCHYTNREESIIALMNNKGLPYRQAKETYLHKSKYLMPKPKRPANQPTQTTPLNTTPTTLSTNATPNTINTEDINNRENHSNQNYLTNTGKSPTTLDLTIVTPNLAHIMDWQVMNQSTLRCDHFPIEISINTKPPESTPATIPKWNLTKANWECFHKSLSTANLQEIKHDNLNTYYTKVVEAINRAATANIPKTTNKSKLPPVPWWTDRCKTAIKAKKAALNKYKRTGLHSDFQSYKQKETDARQIIKEAKNNWKEYCSTLTTNTTSKEIWTKIKRTQDLKMADEGRR